MSLSTSLHWRQPAHPVKRAMRLSHARFQGVPSYAPDIDARISATETRLREEQVAGEIAQAKMFIQTCLARGEKGFVVLDVDETSLDNRGYYRDPGREFYQHPAKGFYETWEVWIARGQASALPPTKALTAWMNQKGIPYVFVTGRIQGQHAATWRNLKNAGVTGAFCQGLYCKPNEWWIGSTASHKKAIVARLEKKLGLKALASIGDSETDMMLNEPARNFRLSTSGFYPPRRI